MIKSSLKLHCLNAVCDDYENVTSVTSDVQNSLKDNIMDAEVRQCLDELMRSGCVNAFEFDEHRGYIPISGANKEFGEIWFLISEKGKQTLDENWIEED